MKLSCVQMDWSHSVVVGRGNWCRLKRESIPLVTGAMNLPYAAEADAELSIEEIEVCLLLLY